MKFKSRHLVNFLPRGSKLYSDNFTEIFDTGFFWTEAYYVRTGKKYKDLKKKLGLCDNYCYIPRNSLSCVIIGSAISRKSGIIYTIQISDFIRLLENQIKPEDIHLFEVMKYCFKKDIDFSQNIQKFESIVSNLLNICIRKENKQMTEKIKEKLKGRNITLELIVP